MDSHQATTFPGHQPLLLKYILETGLRYAPDQEITYRGTVRYDYRTFAERVGRLAGALGALGIGAGDTVAILDWDSHRYLECYFAVPGMAATLHMVNIRLSPEQILYTINHAQDDILLVHPDFLPMLEEIWDRVEPGKKIVLIADGHDAPASTLPWDAEYEQMLADAPASHSFADFEETTRATIFYTSGTTGLPKGVYFSHRQLVLHTLAAATALGSTTDVGRLHRADVYMPITPMFHVHAWGLPFVATLLGLKQVYPGRYVPAKLLDLIRSEAVSFSHCVPTLLHMLLGEADDDLDFNGWKVVLGGSAMPMGLAKEAAARGVALFTGYGMSETCPILTVSQLTPEMLSNSREPHIEIRTRAGLPLPLVDLRIVDANFNEQPRDGASAGEIVVRAPWLTPGYHGDPLASQRLWDGGMLHTGDIGVVRPDGFLQITDRIKDVIKSGGEWVSSLDLEDLISQHPGVSEVAVIGVPDTKWGERPLAIVVPKTQAGAGSVANGLDSHLRQLAEHGTISRYAIPSQILVVDALEKTSVGKIDKKLLRDRYGNGAAAISAVSAA